MEKLGRASAIELIARAICRRAGDDPDIAVLPWTEPTRTRNQFIIVGAASHLSAWQTYSIQAAAALDAMILAGIVSDDLRGPA